MLAKKNKNSSGNDDLNNDLPVEWNGKVTGGGKKKLGNLLDMKDEISRDVLKKRGGNNSATNQGDTGQWWDKPLGEVANAAAKGDNGAETVIKLIKQAKSKANKYKKK